MRRKTKLLHKVLGRLVQLVSQHHPQFQLAQTVARELKVFELLVCCCKLFLLKMARWEEKHMER